MISPICRPRPLPYTIPSARPLSAIFPCQRNHTQSEPSQRSTYPLLFSKSTRPITVRSHRAPRLPTVRQAKGRPFQRNLTVRRALRQGVISRIPLPRILQAPSVLPPRMRSVVSRIHPRRARIGPVSEALAPAAAPSRTTGRALTYVIDGDATSRRSHHRGARSRFELFLRPRNPGVETVFGKCIPHDPVAGSCLPYLGTLSHRICCRCTLPGKSKNPCSSAPGPHHRE